jgi:CRP/FNR family transcriptional regulator, cyclic AMP receptor protein
VAGQVGNEREVYFVLTGCLRVAPYDARQDPVASHIEAGSFFGEVSALEGVPNSLGALALEDSTLAKMPSDVFIATMFNHRPLGEAVIATLVARNRTMTSKIAEVADLYRNSTTEGARPARHGQIRFDASASVRSVSASPRRARRWP